MERNKLAATHAIAFNDCNFSQNEKYRSPARGCWRYPKFISLPLNHMQGRLAVVKAIFYRLFHPLPRHWRNNIDINNFIAVKSDLLSTFFGLLHVT